MPTATAPRSKTRKKALVPQDEAHIVYKDPARQAQMAGLRYATDQAAGISRKTTRAGNFTYHDAQGHKITDPKTLERIVSFVIPPAWADVWIAASPTAHLQVTGRDSLGRKQYRYHPAWDEMRSLTKFSRLRTFGEKLAALREQLNKDLRRPTLDREKVVALVLTLMDQSFIRVGNKEYAKKNNSYGLTTLRDKHVAIEGADVNFSFIGKKGVPHDVTVHDVRLARLVRKCKEIPGQHLFQYYSADGQRHALESGDVNEYLHRHTGLALSAKDFRTWGGTVKMVECLEGVLREEPDLAPEKVIKRAVKEVATGLGNTPTVCSKYYIHPHVVELFKSGQLIEYLRQHDAEAALGDLLSPIERLVLKMLEQA
ncbi:DNA topoisomerase IB [Hymenobacter sp. BT770]|uniref:DNA topoisomerase IB n=1 Tax=Hymenobacter sp. BT770 TaxID=2886942 RepID=UPI001D0F910B|nr:DNA topoisomerase IB [Hymenobacter sp. BT770]MCC3152567.1 DNA topoisomerase IB [Hymenobacter sp. BT770]MDO3414456.1 DNA topoisomerase IB [Hymenobacter sp. BT770]